MKLKAKKSNFTPQVHREHQRGITYSLLAIEVVMFQHAEHLLHCHFPAQHIVNPSDNSENPQSQLYLKLYVYLLLYLQSN